MKVRESDAEKLEARARAVAGWPVRGGGKAAGARGVPHLLFTIQGEHLALPLSAVRAYLREPTVTRFPEGGTAVRGIVAFEGGVVTLLSLERLLGHEKDAETVTGAIVLDTTPPDVAIGIEREEGLVDLDLSHVVRVTRAGGILAGTLPDGRGILDPAAVVADPRGMITKTAETDSDGAMRHGASEG
ncbi:MAG: Purine-binding chemotaxis protein CheW [Labilithrix sp.]|nr:Purine-binding chemotaxis protein CheW [Labilithrix sp.]